MTEYSHNENYRLLRFLAHKYEKRKWQVISRVLDDEYEQPADWSGPPPDMFILKRNRKFVIEVENETTMAHKTIVDKWRSLAANPAYELIIVCREQHEIERARAIGKAYDIPLIAKHVMRTQNKAKSKVRENLFNTDVRMDYLILMIGAIIILGFIFLVGPRISESTRIEDYYRPHDLERQEQILREKGVSRQQIRELLQE